MGPARIRPHLEEGRNAGAYSGRKRIRGSGKTAKFKPATFREFRNVAETPVIVPFRRAAGEESRTGARKAPPVRCPQSGLGPCDPAKDPARCCGDPRPDPRIATIYSPFTGMNFLERHYVKALKNSAGHLWVQKINVLEDAAKTGDR